jgi:TonB family protein
MNSLAIYLIKSGFSLAAFYTLYWLMMRNETHFRLNRMILLFSLFSSLLIPLVSLAFFIKPEMQANLPAFVANLDEIVIGITTSPTINTAHPIDWMRWISFIYFGGVLVVLIRLVYQGIYLQVMSKLSITVRKDNFTIVFVNKDITPFAYFNKIFLPASHEGSQDLHSIIEHEKSHLRQYHFIDLFLIELLTIVQWFNPVVWLYERSLKEIHEYQADEAVLRRGHNKGVYQALLVNQALGGPVFSISNQFNQSLIKKRIMMMTKMKTPRLAQIKVLLFVPLVSLLLFAFANPEPLVQKGMEFLNTAEQSVLYVYKPAKAVKSAVLKDTIKRLAIDEIVINADKEDKPLTFVEKMPEYPGGIDSMMHFLAKNIKYPKTAFDMGISGRVILQFVINKEGKIENVKILRGIGGGCDEEALRVIKMMPNWEPGMDKGKIVSVYFTIPVVFTLKNH